MFHKKKNVYKIFVHWIKINFLWIWKLFEYIYIIIYVVVEILVDDGCIHYWLFLKIIIILEICLFLWFYEYFFLFCNHYDTLLSLIQFMRTMCSIYFLIFILVNCISMIVFCFNIHLYLSLFIESGRFTRILYNVLEFISVIAW